MSAPEALSASPAWSLSAADELYGFSRWGSGHFAIDDDGQVVIDPYQDGRRIRLLDVMAEARAKGLSAPLTIRFQDVLHHRVLELQKAFDQAIAGEEYPGRYRGVFPIKVNQMREVVEEILEAGRDHGFGLEVGSKPELLIGLALHDNPDSLIICNGYKDEAYLRLALMGRKLGKNIFIVLEQISELELLLPLAREMGVEPLLGIRVKLNTSGEGKWAESSGTGAKFGLSAPEIVEAARRLRRAGLRNSLQLVHFHIGSQVPNILTIKRAVIEAARFYAELHRMGFPMKYLDVGGGLGLDYDGSRSNAESSMNYRVDEYARDIVYNVKTTCEHVGAPPPDLISESGRALVGTHSVLVVEVVDRVAKRFERATGGPPRKRHKVLRDLRDALENRHGYGRLERFHDAQQKFEEAMSLFSLGYLDLESRAEAEVMFWQACREIYSDVAEIGYVPDELMELQHMLAEQYVCNFSVFQSLLDHWACDQLFPIAPLHRLDEEPTVDARLVDITCDSEGKIDRFIDLAEDSRPFLRLHPLQADKPYHLGIFLVGAYQDIMGDLHNLFGRVSEVHVFLEDDEEDGFYIEEAIKGSDVASILPFVQHRGPDLLRRMKRVVDKATKKDVVKPREGVALLRYYEDVLSSETYLSPANRKPRKRRARSTDGKKAKEAKG